MGNKDYLSGGCDLPGKLLYEKLDKKENQQKNKQKMIMPENLNENSEQNSYTECVIHENITLPSPLTPLLYTLALKTLHPPPPTKKSDLDSLSKFTYRELKIRLVGFVLKK